MTFQIRLIALVTVASISVASAQVAAPPPAVKPVSATAGTIVDIKSMSPEARSAAALAQSSEPAFDEHSAQRMVGAIRRYKDMAAKGGWTAIPANAKFAMGDAGAIVDQLRQRLIVTNDLAATAAGGPYNEEVVAAVKRYQARNGLLSTGLAGPKTQAALNVPVEKRIQQLEASLQRMDAIGFKFGDRYVVVNIPAAFAEAVDGGTVVRRYRVVVGKMDKPSPTVTSQIGSVTLNPTWTVPASITKREISAHLRKDPNYLQRMHMQVLDSHDGVVDPASVDWSEGKTPNVTVRQESGEWNALGRVRVDMPNSYSVYMHDTNQKNLFSEDYRFDSHGCARVDNIRDLAAWLLKDTPNWERAQIDQAIATDQRQAVKLVKAVPVAWIYLTAWTTRDLIVQFRDDVYGQDAQLTEASAEQKAFFKQATDTVVR